jgi:hypothetical protein
MADAFPISGNIDPRAFPFLLTDLHRHGATGSLKVEGPTYQKALYFRSGRILFGSSNDPRDQLGAILIENGKITPEQLEEVNTKVGPGRPLAKVLSESGLVSQQELSEAAQIKVERILWDIITYASGSFEFEDGVLPKGAVDLKLSTERLILAAVRRVTDQEFIERHLGSTDVVLRPTSELAARLHEVQADAGGIAEQIDGTRTLKDAAAASRLDPFEAAKVACGLLILGLVEKPPQDDEVAPFVLPQEEPGSIDLGQTALGAMEATVQPEPTVEPEPSEPETPFFVPEAVAPPPLIAPGPPAFAMEAEPEDEGPVIALPPTLEAPIPPPIPEPPPPIARPSGTGTGSSPGMLPLVPPPPRDQPIRPPAEEPPLPDISDEPPVPSVPPSREDLAALDALLNPRRGGAPVPPPPPPMDRGSEWEPRFSLAGGGRRAPDRGSALKPILVGFAALVVIGGGAAGAWMYLGQPEAKKPGQGARPAASPASTPASATPTSALTPEPSTPTPAVSTAKTSAATAPPTAPPTQPPTAPPTRSPAPQGGADAGGLGGARTLLRSGRYGDAADAFAQHVRRTAKTGFTVQLLVACSDDTVRKAVEGVPQDELFIVPVSYKGRSCYRMGWGLYDSEARAEAARRSLPSYFSQPGVTPRVVAALTFLQ